MWQTEAVVMIRHYVNDLDPNNQTYSDERLQELFLVAAKKVTIDVSFGGALVNPVPGTTGVGETVPYNIDLEALDISPDPIDNNDVGFMVLVGYQSAAILTMSEFKTAAGQALSIRDGSSAVDLKGIAREKGLAAKFYKENYEEARFQFQLSDRSSYQAIMGPISILTAGYYGNYLPMYGARERPMFN